MCLEIARLDASSRATVTRAASENIPKGTTCVDLMRSKGQHGRQRACSVRASSLAEVLQAAAPHLGSPNAVLLLNAYAHGAPSERLDEPQSVGHLLTWLSAQRSTLPYSLPGGFGGAQVAWRTREAEHYGEHGWNGTLEHRQCSALTASQRARLARPLERSTFAAAERAGVWLLDGGAATADAYEAHPSVCTDAGGYIDCRHFCQPGPVDLWNAALVDALERNSSAGFQYL